MTQDSFRTVPSGHDSKNVDLFCVLAVQVFRGKVLNHTVIMKSQY